ncbi:hypothetical protein HY991_04950 [Candidatus Micrarchaeota archaeon]|nr:hypothetical protein [Candidatus Micrarchaeota archaeon]
MATPVTDEKIRVCIAFLEPEQTDVKITASQLRGFVGYLFLDDGEFHHHMTDAYHYPLIQYKTVKGQPIILGIGPYADKLLNKISGLDSVVTPGKVTKIKTIDLRTFSHALDTELHTYEFITPWIALNRRNYEAYQNANAENRKRLLEKILIGNVLSSLKGLGIFLKRRVEVYLSEFSTVPVTAHGNTFQAINAKFVLNLGLPEYMGLGKSVSKGFGTIKVIK